MKYFWGRLHSDRVKSWRIFRGRVKAVAAGEGFLMNFCVFADELLVRDG